jgi:NAD(P)-dependent dehydrogenase (short-subunit alcohol dehydrogenase family)
MGVAIVTGGNRGLGVHIVAALIRDGHKVAVIHRGPTNNLINCLEIALTDVANEAVVVRAVEQVLIEFRQVDILVNNAGLYVEGFTQNVTLQKWNQCLSVNLTGAFLMIQQVLPSMQYRRHGRIVNVGSFGATRGLAGAVAYNASKAGLVGLTKTVANENAGYSITCNLVQPGCIDTGMFRIFPENIQRKLVELSASGRAGRVDEIAESIRWLCSPAASYITGQIINIDGGVN